MKLNDLCYITLYVRDISEYSTLNQVYNEMLNFQNPPTRVCVETCLPSDCHVILDAVAFKAGHVIEADYKRHTMHVQGISHWSPANIGPYSQSTKISEITYISGQIGLIPGNMSIINGGIKQECKLTLRHINRIAKAMNSHGQLRDVVQGICFVTHPNYITEARRQWVRNKHFIDDICDMKFNYNRREEQQTPSWITSSFPRFHARRLSNGRFGFTRTTISLNVSSSSSIIDLN